MVSPVILSLNVLLSSDSARDNDKKGKRREKKRYYKKKGDDAHVSRSGTPTRAPPTPPPTRTPPTSPSTRDSSSPTSATSASWQRTTRRKRLNLDPPLNMQPLVMRVILVMMRITCLLFLPILTCTKREIE
jgi:hypothetical protein